MFQKGKRKFPQREVNQSCIILPPEINKSSTVKLQKINNSFSLSKIEFQKQNKISTRSKKKKKNKYLMNPNTESDYN